MAQDRNQPCVRAKCCCAGPRTGGALTLNRPEARNALSEELMRGAAERSARRRRTAESRVVVIAGAGSRLLAPATI